MVFVCTTFGGDNGAKVVPRRTNSKSIWGTHVKISTSVEDPMGLMERCFNRAVSRAGHQIRRARSAQPLVKSAGWRRRASLGLSVCVLARFSFYACVFNAVGITRYLVLLLSRPCITANTRRSQRSRLVHLSPSASALACAFAVALAFVFDLASPGK